MLLAIKSDKKYISLWALADEVGTETFLEWAIPKYMLADVEVQQFKTFDNIVGFSDTETIADWFDDQKGNYIVEYIDDRNTGHIRVMEIEK